MTPPLLVVDDLKTHFFTRRGITRAVDGVSFTLRAGETLALVGESGSGKSVTCLSVVRLHQGLRGASLRARALEALRRLRIAAAETRLGQFQHQLSGGMRQRVSSAIAMSCAPRLLIADEPTTSLDVTIQAQYLDLLKEVQQATGVAIILVTHDFGIVAANADRVAVMYAGRIVEIGSTLDVFNAPAHP